MTFCDASATSSCTFSKEDMQHGITAAGAYFTYTVVSTHLAAKDQNTCSMLNRGFLGFRENYIFVQLILWGIRETLKMFPR